MKQAIFSVLTIVSILLASCGAESPASVSTDVAVDKPSGVIPQHQLDALKKAKEVENLLLDSAEARKNLMLKHE